MSGQIVNRPYVGTWQLNNKGIVEHTPDCLVYINGDTSLPGCATCGGRIDLQPYIVSTDCDPSIEGPATANVSLHMPRHIGDALYRDGQLLLRPGLEIHIYYRGYFPVKGILADMMPEQTGGVDLSKAIMYPYYLCFHGVVTEVSHEYSGGEHTVSMSCNDMLHFWEYQRISEQGSLFGARPTNSKVRMNLIGHNFTGLSPYAIIYTLFRDVMGAAGGVEFALGNKTNAAANSSVVGESLWSMSLLYWQARFAESMTRLRMYGIDGTLYNKFQQAFLASLRSKDAADLGKRMADKNKQSTENDPLSDKAAMAEVLGFDPHSFYGRAESEKSAKTNDMGISIPKIHAFVTDINNWGQVNFFESVYMTKMEVSNIVKEAVGYEFYQDVDGDIVFKPPFYNLDTSDSRVYVLKPIDIISFSVSETEPVATVVKGTGSWFQNMNGVIDGEWGTRAEFIDYRLVAQYGWRQQTFETSYHTDPKAIFWAAVSRFDLFNIGVNSATCQIPQRPELRPGYPVYIEHLDCFYYLRAFNHSFSYGGTCTTTLTLEGKRAKFYAPGNRPDDGTRATVENIDLSDPHLPTLPLEVKPEGQSQYRLQGFPNVVMTLDPNNVNPLQFMRGAAPSDYTSKEAMQQLITVLRDKGIIQIDHSNATTTDMKTLRAEGPWQIQAGNDAWEPLPCLTELTNQATTLAAAYEQVQSQPQDKADEVVAAAQEKAPEFTLLITAAQTAFGKAFSGDPDSSASRLEMLNDLKAAFNPGGSLPGYYRYYSSAHPTPEMQGPHELSYDESKGVISPGASVTCAGTCTQFADDGKDNFLNTGGKYSMGIPVLAGGAVVPTPTHAIKNLQFAQFSVTRTKSSTSLTGGYDGSFDAARYQAAVMAFLVEKFNLAPPCMEDRLSSTGDNYYLSVVTDLCEQVSATVGWELASEGYKAPFTAVDRGDGTYDATALNAEEVWAVSYTGYPRQASSYDTLLGDVGSTTEEAILTLAQGNAASIADYAVTILQVRASDWYDQGGETAVSSSADNGNEPENVDAAWASCWALVGARVPSLKPPKRVTTWDTVEDKHIVPVFPVSDERGYEVVGTYKYGRGMSVQAGGNFDDLNTQSKLDVLSYEAVEDILDALQTQDADYGKAAAASLDPETNAALAAEGILDDSVLKDGLVIEGKETDAINRIRNFMSTDKESTQKMTVVNAAYSLAQMGADVHTRDICSCRGAEASILLEAFNDSYYAVVDQPDQVQQWLADQATASAVTWKVGQDAVAGQILDTSASQAWEEAISAYSGAVGTLQSSVSAFQDSSQEATALFQDFTASLQDDEG